MIIVTLGDPGGIGPEIIVKALESLKKKVLIIGSKKALEFYGKLLGMEQWRRSEIFDPLPDETFIPGRPYGRASFFYLKEAISLLERNRAKALVTGPISKKAWVNDGFNYMGHTHYFESRYGDLIMAFWSEGMKVALFTHHLPLREALNRVKIDNFHKFLENLKKQIEKFFPGENIICSSVNPHAGEDGEMGKEETEVLKPVLKKESIQGPFPSDTAFLRAELKREWVIAFFHDVGLAPFKLLHFYDGAEITFGLPWIRTSPCHGTAYEIASKGIASEGSMKTAISLAMKLIV